MLRATRVRAVVVGERAWAEREAAAQWLPLRASSAVVGMVVSTLAGAC